MVPYNLQSAFTALSHFEKVMNWPSDTILCQCYTSLPDLGSYKMESGGQWKARELIIH